MGFDFFSSSSEIATPNASQGSSIARLMVRRGSQIFIVVNNEIRWADLIYLKDYYDEAKSRGRRNGAASETSFPETIFRVRDCPEELRIQGR